MVGADTGQGFIFSVTNSTVRYEIKLDVTTSGVSVDNLVFKPMIRRVEDTDPTWQPYAKTNRELTAVFTSSDTTDANATSWTSVTKLDSRESYSSIFAKMSQMFKNIRYLYKMLGTTDISQIGGGNVTGAIASLNSALANENKFSTSRVNIGITDNTKSYTCPSDGCLWVCRLDVEPVSSCTVFVNNIPRLQLNKYIYSTSLLAKKGDVITATGMLTNGGYFYPHI
jgi:hypothetical protein